MVVLLWREWLREMMMVDVAGETNIKNACYTT